MLSNTQYGKSKLQKIKNSNTQFQPWLEQHKAFSRINAEPINIYKNIIWFFTPNDDHWNLLEPEMATVQAENLPPEVRFSPD